MTKKKTFNEVGDTDDKVTWNTAGTRKWRMTYTLLEVKPSWRKAKSPEATKKDSSTAKVATRKPKKAKKTKPKKVTKSGARSKPKKPESQTQNSFRFDA